jgi:hypothetical protein
MNLPHPKVWAGLLESGDRYLHLGTEYEVESVDRTGDDSTINNTDGSFLSVSNSDNTYVQLLNP